MNEKANHQLEVLKAYRENKQVTHAIFKGLGTWPPEKLEFWKLKLVVFYVSYIVSGKCIGFLKGYFCSAA